MFAAADTDSPCRCSGLSPPCSRLLRPLRSSRPENIWIPSPRDGEKARPLFSEDSQGNVLGRVFLRSRRSLTALAHGAERLQSSQKRRFAAERGGKHFHSFLPFRRGRNSPHKSQDRFQIIALNCSIKTFTFDFNSFFFFLVEMMINLQASGKGFRAEGGTPPRPRPPRTRSNPEGEGPAELSDFQSGAGRSLGCRLRFFNLTT